MFQQLVQGAGACEAAAFVALPYFASKLTGSLLPVTWLRLGVLLDEALQSRVAQGEDNITMQALLSQRSWDSMDP